jgi:hypothetical protein
LRIGAALLPLHYEPSGTAQSTSSILKKNIKNYRKSIICLFNKWNLISPRKNTNAKIDYDDRIRKAKE